MSCVPFLAPHQKQPAIVEVVFCAADRQGPWFGVVGLKLELETAAIPGTELA